MDLWLAGGLSINKETSTENISTNNMEAVLGTEFQLFKFHNPEIKILLDWTIFYSLTVADRFRYSGNLKVKFEVFKDFYFNLTYYDSYDNNSPSSTSSDRDYGFTTSISYSF